MEVNAIVTQRVFSGCPFHEHPLFAVSLQPLAMPFLPYLKKLSIILATVFGYYNNNHVNPYLYSGTNIYVSGKYVEISNGQGGYKSVYKEELVDDQIGVYVLLYSIL